MIQYDERPLLSVKDLCKDFPISRNQVSHVVKHVSFEVHAGETFGLVGGSGSGKTTIGRTLIRLHDPTSGEIEFDGRKISGKLSHSDLRFLRRNMEMIFQDPYGSLNPRRSVGDQIGAGLEINGLCKNREEREELVRKTLMRVGLDQEYMDRFPGQLSGGQCQRVGIARALVMKPKMIIADECISALDASVQAQVVNLLSDIKEENHVAMLFIAHDLSMVRYISDRIGVLYLGNLVEVGTPDEIFEDPRHPYTRHLLSAIPVPDPIIEKNRRRSEAEFVFRVDQHARMRALSPTHSVLE